MADWRCAAARNLPIDERDTWDGSAAKGRVFAWAGWPDNPDSGKARKAFLIFDASAPDLKGSYKLPIGDIVNDTLTAIAGGLHAAASRLPQTDAPQAVLDEARGVLDAYFAKLDDRGAQDRATSVALPAVATFPAPITTRATSADLLTLAQARALDPAIFDEYPPLFWAARISNNQLDAYYTRMMPSSLQNYAADAAAGVAFQDSHQTDGLVRTLGHSLTGRYVGTGGDGVAHTDAEFYTLPGLAPAIDDYVRKMRAGLVRDVSIGFYGGAYRCSICGRDMLTDFNCWHIPGFEYDAVDERTGKQTGQRVTATADVEDAHLAEVSGVYDGATPGAGIIGLKARQVAEAGRLRPEGARLLEARYRLHLPGTARSYPVGIDLRHTAHQEEDMTTGTEERRDAPTPSEEHAATAQLTALTTSIRDVATAAGLTASDDAPALVRALGDEVRRLRPLADDGRQYRTDLVAEALEEGVRALGEGFAAETYKGMLDAAPLATVKRMRDDWRAVGDQRFPGGRQTTEGEPAPQENVTPLPTRRKRPAKAYSG